MATEKKIQTVQELKEKFERAKLTVLTDYRGLSTTDLNSLRNELAELDSEYQITKNTLTARALKEAGKDALVTEEALVGPTAILFAYQDESSPVKSVLKTIKALSLPILKGGFLGNQAISASQVESLGRLPSKEILLAKVVGGMSSPLYGLVNVLQGNIRNLVYTLSAIGKTKST